jgi:hypothetical protein
MKRILAVAFMTSTIMGVAHARPAQCEITEIDRGSYKGPCDFQATKGGSFSISFPEKAGDYLNVSFLNVEIVRPGFAYLSGAVWGRGMEDAFGTLSREKSKPACWSGEWGRVCVY